jgi:hypothetical protein
MLAAQGSIYTYQQFCQHVKILAVDNPQYFFVNFKPNS